MKKTIKEIIDGAYCPIPIEAIPNTMGINLCSVESVEWTKQEDGQLVNLSINFSPDNGENPMSKGIEDLRESTEKEIRENLKDGNHLEVICEAMSAITQAVAIATQNERDRIVGALESRKKGWTSDGEIITNHINTKVDINEAIKIVKEK